MKHTRYILLFLLLLVAAPFSPLRAFDDEGLDKRYRYQIRGVVVDENDEPMPGVAVHVVNTTFGAGTNADGEFSISLSEEKSYTLQVSFVGYEPQRLEASAAERPQTLRVKLLPSENQLNEVSVTGSFVEKPLKNTPVITRVISQKDIQALNPQNIETLLQYGIPGLQIGYNSMSQLPEITYQGMDSEYILFLVDGERVSGEGADHNVDFTRFNVDDIERIEIIKGAQSTIYGSNALGGVINIITKTANRPFTANLSARYAGSNGQNYSGSIGLKKDRLTSFTSLSFRSRNTYTIGDSEGKTTVTEGSDGSTTTTLDAAQSSTVYGYNIWDFTQKLGYTINEKLSVDVKGTYYWNQRDIRPGRLYQEYYVDYCLSGRVKYLPAEGQQIVLSYIYDNYKKDNHFYRIDSTYTNYRNVKQTPRLEYSGRFGNHTVSVGAEGEFEYLHHYMLEDSSHVNNKAFALYAQEDWTIIDGLNVIAGLRADYHEKYHWHVTPKISAMYHMGEHFIWRAGYAQGFRSPDLKELYMSYDMGGLGAFMIYGNEDLEPETSHQYSLSGEYTLGGLNASVALSHNRLHNRITYAALGNDLQYVNAENAKTTSVECIARYRFDWGLMVTGSYAYTNDYQEVDGRNISAVRPHSVTFSAMYSRKFGKIGFNAALNGQWASALDTYTRDTDSDGNYTYTLTHYDGRTLCSLNIGATLPRGIALNFGVDNVLNYKDKAADSSLQVPQKGTSFVGTVRLNIADMLGL